MYVHQSRLGAGILDVLGETLGDWIKKQVGLPTSAEERASSTRQMLEVQREVAERQLQAQKSVQTAMIAGAAIVGGLALFLAFRGK